MRTFIRIVLFTLLGGVVLVCAALAWAFTTANGRYAKHWDVHPATFPIPFPPTAADSAAAGPGGNADSVALAQAEARGSHLVNTRIGCVGCHGPNLAGGVIIDVPVVGYWAAPNLTPGEGSVTKGFSAHEWDMAVRHGVRHTGLTSSMPCNDFEDLTDHEMSDIVTYIQRVPPVNKTIKPVRFGPVFAFLMAMDPKQLAPFAIDHTKAHVVEPPAEAVTVEFGNHISKGCAGCHGTHFSGGKMQGDPNMPIVANISPDPTGIKSWSEDNFVTALRTGKRPDGSAIDPAMPWQMYGHMNDTELKAIYAYLRTVPPMPKGNH